LSAYDPATGKFKNYTTEDGLQEDEFKLHSALKASDGRLYFGGVNGFNVFCPSDIVKPAAFSPIMITSFQIFNKPITGAAKNGNSSGLDLDISDTRELSLSYKQTFFSIEYAALDFSSADKKKYAFMLEGFDEEWNYVGNRNTASYTNVPQGHYVFKVKYQNSNGVWSPEYVKFQIVVRPPFWLTWWFISLAALAVIGCIFTYIRIRLHSIRSQKINLEIQVRKKTAVVVAQNEALEAQQAEINHKNESLQSLIHEKDNLLMEKEWLLKEIHHRVKNNFHIVSSLLEIQSSYLKNKEALSAIKDSQHRIHSMSIIHQKLYQSETLSTIRMPEYIYELVEYLRESYAIRENVGFSLQIDNIELNHASAITLGLILNEAITNAIKYAFAKTKDGKISISLAHISDSQILLSIADNGRGLPIHFDSKIGASMGMELLQGLTDDLGGSFSIETNEGTHIKVIFDYKRATAGNVSFSQ
jgi:two-component sensor histidine kinase